MDRLSLFPTAQVARIKRRIGYKEPIGSPSWPELHDVVIILFSSRTGSTVLCRRIQQEYELGIVGEAMNPPKIKSAMQRNDLSSPAEAAAHIVSQHTADEHFVCKAGAPGIIVMEALGFSSHYLPVTKFVMLIRQDIVAQAISLVKANMSGQFHSNQEQQRTVSESDYDYKEISKQVKIICNSNQIILSYIEATNRSAPKIFYEDFESGDNSRIFQIFDDLGLMRRSADAQVRVREVSMLDRTINRVWHERFMSELSKRDVDMLRIHQEEIIGATV